ncbi:kinase-like domain-containing protein [Phellopilus nigrolimitatus]|nr:kinase-like domain-containing protein [Phellopilus nigrolimitatus]
MGAIRLEESMGNMMNRYIVLELARGGSLWDAIERADGPLDETYVRSVAAELKQCINHRDIKPENILLTARGRPLLVDFGMAVQLDNGKGTTGSCGTPGYTAPEVIRQARELDFYTKHFIGSLLEKDPHKRAKAEDAKQSAYLEGIDWIRVASGDYNVPKEWMPPTSVTDVSNIELDKKILLDTSREFGLVDINDDEELRFTTGLFAVQWSERDARVVFRMPVDEDPPAFQWEGGLSVATFNSFGGVGPVIQVLSALIASSSFTSSTRTAHLLRLHLPRAVHDIKLDRSQPRAPPHDNSAGGEVVR